MDILELLSTSSAILTIKLQPCIRIFVRQQKNMEFQVECDQTKVVKMFLCVTSCWCTVDLTGPATLLVLLCIPRDVYRCVCVCVCVCVF